jgi:hypothetical protein
VHEAKSDALLRKSAEDLFVLLLNRRMSSAAIGVDDDGIRAIEGVLDLWPAIGINRDTHARDASKALLEQKAASAKFVHSRWMTWLAGDEDDLFLGRFDAEHGDQKHQTME